VTQNHSSNRKLIKKVTFAPGTKRYDQHDKDIYSKLVGQSNLLKFASDFDFTTEKKPIIKRIKRVDTDQKKEFLVPLYNRFTTLQIEQDENEIEIESELEEEKELSPRPIKMGRKKVRKTPTKLVLDKEMNEIEKDEAIKDFDTKGYYQPSISQILDDTNTVTELSLVDDKPMSDQEFLRLFETKHLSPEIKQMAHKIFKENRSAFALHKYDIGKTDKIEMEIELNSNEGRMQKYTPIPMNVRDQVKEILDQLLKYDIIRVCNEPSKYCSNILVVPKKDKGSIRLLFDGRLLNNDTVRYPMALISKPEILAHLIGKTHLTSLDFADAFFHIPLSKEAQKLTAFYSHTHGLRMCFTRAPQGLKNSPLYLKLLLDSIFADMTDVVLFYADDLLIASDGTLEDHLRILEEVLRRLADAKLKLRPQKLLIARDTVEFLGMVFNKDSIDIPEAKLEAFKKLPSPKTPKQCKSVIMCLSFYRQFCPRFAELSREIMELSILHAKQFKWEDKHEKQFRQLISEVCKNASLYLPNPAKTFYVQTDASQYCAAGRIYQKNEKGEEQIIAAVSRTFTKTERAYSIFKKEILALLYTLKSMDYFLRYATKLVILVDAKSIIYLRLAKESSGILLRFSLELSKYNAEIFHVSGEDNIISDVLSRQHPNIEKIQEEIEANATMSEKDSIKLVSRLALPKGFQFTEEETKLMLDSSSPPALSTKKTLKSKATTGKRNIKNEPATLGRKQLNLPKTTNYRPGMLLPFNMARTEPDTEDEAPPSPDFQGFANDYDTEDEDQIFAGLNLAEENLGDSDATQNESESESQEFDNESTLSAIGDPLPSSENEADSEVEENPEIEDTISYTDVGNVTDMAANGMITTKQFAKAQRTDEFCMNKKDLIRFDNHFTIIEGVLCRKDGERHRPVLPQCLYNTIIQTKHFTAFGAHMSTTRILRDTKKYYFLPGKNFEERLKTVTSECYLCQIFNTNIPAHEVQQLPKVTAPRVSWSIDMITDPPTTLSGNKQILLCVDDFSSYVVCIPLKNATSENVLKGLKDMLFNQFGIPKTIRSDQQASFYNSTMFFDQMEKLGVNLTTTAVASPFSNARAESQIKNIKHMMRKFIQQEGVQNRWDDYLQILTNSHNKSIGTYGWSAEELMFGNKSASRIDLLDFNLQANDQEDYIEHVLNKAEETRRKARANMDTKAKQNRTFKNRNKVLKDFKIGSLVLHKCLQASTGSSSKYKPLFDGPYTIIRLDNDGCTATLQHLVTTNLIRAHFTNMQLLKYSPDSLRLRGLFEQDFLRKLAGNEDLDSDTDQEPGGTLPSSPEY